MIFSKLLEFMYVYASVQYKDGGSVDECMYLCVTGLFCSLGSDKTHLCIRCAQCIHCNICKYVSAQDG